LHLLLFLVGSFCFDFMMNECLESFVELSVCWALRLIILSCWNVWSAAYGGCCILATAHHGFSFFVLKQRKKQRKFKGGPKRSAVPPLPPAYYFTTHGLPLFSCVILHNHFRPFFLTCMYVPRGVTPSFK
jgi:hypothetical protein